MNITELAAWLNEHWQLFDMTNKVRKYCVTKKGNAKNGQFWERGMANLNKEERAHVGTMMKICKDYSLTLGETLQWIESHGRLRQIVGDEAKKFSVSDIIEHADLFRYSDLALIIRTNDGPGARPFTLAHAEENGILKLILSIMATHYSSAIEVSSKGHIAAHLAQQCIGKYTSGKDDSIALTEEVCRSNSEIFFRLLEEYPRNKRQLIYGTLRLAKGLYISTAEQLETLLFGVPAYDTLGVPGFTDTPRKNMYEDLMGMKRSAIERHMDLDVFRRSLLIHGEKDWAKRSSDDWVEAFNRRNGIVVWEDD